MLPKSVCPSPWPLGSAATLAKNSTKNARFGVLLTTLIAFFLLEMGDKTQIATVALAAKYDALVYVSTCMSVGYSDIFAKSPMGKALGSVIMTFGPAMALVPDEGAPEPPSATVTPACGGEPVRLTAWGIHEVELALRPSPGERSCAIAIDPGYVYLDPQSLRRISAELRRVVWSPGTAEPAAPEDGPEGGPGGDLDGDSGAPSAAP